MSAYLNYLVRDRKIMIGPKYDPSTFGTVRTHTKLLKYIIRSDTDLTPSLSYVKIFRDLPGSSKMLAKGSETSGLFNILNL